MDFRTGEDPGSVSGPGRMPPRGQTPRRVAIVEPWFGESHAALFSGLARNSLWDATLFTLAARKWRWRMRLGAYHLRAQLRGLPSPPDALLVSDYVNLPHLKCFAPEIRDVPTAVYFLENQLTYPARDGRGGDFEFAAINVLTCLAADAVVFCSRQHEASMLAALPGFLKHDPDADVAAVVGAIRAKSSVIPIGVDLDLFDGARKRRPDRTGRPLRIVWPHRFEHDKGPEILLEVMRDLAVENLPFELSLLGRSYRDTPPDILEMKETLSGHIADFGFFEGEAYANALAASDIVVSTARQETQGIAIIEAIRAGCDPLLPDRLSYPEVLGPELSKKHLYTSKGELRRRLRWMIRHPDRVRATSCHWQVMDRFGWKMVAPQFDVLFERISGRSSATDSSPRS